jgi:hypothetical protein
VSRFLIMLRYVIRDKHPRVDGRDPVRRLVRRLRERRPVRLPIPDGIVPVRELSFRNSEVR